MSESLGRAASFGRAISFEALTVSSTAVALTVPTDIHSAFCSTDGETVRFRMDGSDPTATVGHKLPLDTFIEFYRDDLKHLKFIATGADATVFVTYYKS